MQMTVKLSQEFSWTEGRTLSTLDKLDDFFLNFQVQEHPGTLTQKNRNQMRIVPKMILVLK